LENHRSLLAWAPDWRAVELHFTGIGFNQAQEDIEESAFAATRRSDHADKLPFGYFEAEIAQGGDGLTILGCKD
jgi:hypothetical protein